MNKYKDYEISEICSYDDVKLCHAHTCYKNGYLIFLGNKCFTEPKPYWAAIHYFMDFTGLTKKEVKSLIKFY